MHKYVRYFSSRTNENGCTSRETGSLRASTGKKKKKKNLLKDRERFVYGNAMCIVHMIV